MLRYVKGRKMENNEPIRDQEIEIDLVALFHELVKHLWHQWCFLQQYLDYTPRLLLYRSMRHQQRCMY